MRCSLSLLPPTFFFTKSQTRVLVLVRELIACPRSTHRRGRGGPRGFAPRPRRAGAGDRTVGMPSERSARLTQRHGRAILSAWPTPLPSPLFNGSRTNGMYQEKAGEPGARRRSALRPGARRGQRRSHASSPRRAGHARVDVAVVFQLGEVFLRPLFSQPRVLSKYVFTDC